MNKRPYIRMTTEELARATREFDSESVQTRNAPMSPQLKARLERAMSKQNRRGQAGPPKRVLVRIENALLRRADQVAKKRGLSRSELISSALRQALRRKSA
jgi:predicted DNA binding CopG/RHH family protein